jgi:hypothetical protein
VREILETAMLLANREQEIHSKELISRVLMGVLDNIDKVKLQKKHKCFSSVGLRF